MTAVGAVRIRDASVADAPAIAYAHRQCWLETYRGHLPDSVVDGRTAAEFDGLWAERTAGRDGGHLCVAEGAGGTLAGFASGGRLRVHLPGYDGELLTLYVLARYQRQGLGAAMFARIRDGMAAAGYRFLVAQVLATTPASGFYRRLGGDLVERRTTPYRGAATSVVYFAWPLV